MKTIVLSNLKQVFETIMTLCNILQLRVLSHNKNVVVYSDLFNDEKIIILNKEYSEVIYHDYTNNVHVIYEINNSESLFVEYYNRCEELYKEIETLTDESIEEIDYLNNHIETLRNRNIELSKANEQMNNKLAYYETEYQDIVAEKVQQYEDKCNHLTEIAKRTLAKKDGEITQLKNIINDRDMVISTMKKRIKHLYAKINSKK